MAVGVRSDHARLGSVVLLLLTFFGLGLVLVGVAGVP